MDLFFRGLRFSHVFCTYCQGPTLFFVIVADNKRCFSYSPPNVVAGVGCTKNHPKNAVISRKNWEELLLGRHGFLDWLWREELCEHLWRIRRWAAAAASTRRRAAVHRGCFFREEGWLTAPCIAHHHTRTVRRWYTVSWFTKNGTIIFLTSGKLVKS